MCMNDEKIGVNSCVTAASCLKGEIQESLHTVHSAHRGVQPNMRLKGQRNRNYG